MSLKYDVALSFAGEDREYVEEVAELLAQRGVKVFYDQFERAELWGKNLYVHLDDIYRQQSRYCVVFLSKYYAEKRWTSHERESAQTRAFFENREYILPVRIDDTEIPGIRPTTGYISKLPPSDLVALVLQKLGKPLLSGLALPGLEDDPIPLCLHFSSLIELDVGRFTETLRPYLRWQAENMASSLPVEIHFHRDLTLWIDENLSLIRSDHWPPNICEEAKDCVRTLYTQQLGQYREEMVAGIRLLVSAARWTDQQESKCDAVSLADLTLSVVTYISSRTVMIVIRCLQERIHGMKYPKWMQEFYSIKTSWGTPVPFIIGLGYVMKATLEETLYWVDADIEIQSRLLGNYEIRRVYLPFTFLIEQLTKGNTSRETIFRYLIPQLVDRVAVETGKVPYMCEAMRVPLSLNITERNERVIDVDDLKTVNAGSESLRKLEGRLREFLSAKNLQTKYIVLCHIFPD
jgi:hypothetical protein